MFNEVHKRVDLRRCLKIKACKQFVELKRRKQPLVCILHRKIEKQASKIKGCKGQDLED